MAEKTEDKENTFELEEALASKKDDEITPIIAKETAKMEIESEEHTLKSQINILSEMVQGIKSIIEEKLAYDETKERMFQLLYQQLKDYKEGLLEGIQKPIIKALLPLYDSIIRVGKVVSSHTISEENLKNEIDMIKFELEEILYRMDAVPFIDHPEVLDRKLHKTIKVIETSDPNEDKQVVEIVRYGFLWKNNILRPEEVIIKKYNPKRKEDYDA